MKNIVEIFKQESFLQQWENVRAQFTSCTLNPEMTKVLKLGAKKLLIMLYTIGSIR